MPLTIERALKEIPVLRAAKVVAGEQNLNQVIRWTHIIDHPEIVPWVQEGYLLLTTAFALMLDPESQKDLIPRLAEKKLAGMIVNIGRYMGEIPAGMVVAAHRLNFPLMTLPWEANFTDVTHAIHERIVKEQYALTEQAFHIHEVLTQIVIQGGGLDTLASRLADLLRRSITIEDASFFLLAHQSLEPTDSVRARSITDGRTPSEIVAYHTAQGLYEQLRQERRPLKVEPIPALGLTLERVVAPIMVGPQLLGYIWVIATDHPLTELDFLAIERGASIAALILSREQAVYQAEQRVKNQLFEQALDPQSSWDGEGVAETLKKLGFASEYQILIVECHDDQPQILKARMVESCGPSAGVNALVTERGGRLVVILGSESNLKTGEFALQVLAHGTESHTSFTIGISSRATGAGEFRAAYEEALNALRVGRAISPQGGPWSRDNLGYMLGLLNLPEESRQATHYRTLIARLAAYDEKHGAHLVKTLEVYLDHLADIRQAAQVLFIHRNSLYQRLEKISQLCQVDLKDSLTIVNLYLALKDWNLHIRDSSSLGSPE